MKERERHGEKSQGMKEEAKIHDARGEIDRDKNMIGKKRRYMDVSGVTDGTKERKR